MAGSRPKSQLICFAERELAPYFNDPDPDIQRMGKNIMALVEVWDKQGHSGASGAHVLATFERLIYLQPLNIQP